jgi:hypothetical protein
MRGRRMTVTSCTVANCDRKPLALDLCQMHYMRQHRHGTTHRPTHKELFWRNIAAQLKGFCWVWNGRVDKDGYGSFGIWKDGKGTNYRAHRMAYEILKGPIPQGLTIDHLCRNKRCVNPEHMEPVTAVENLKRGHRYRKAFPEQ